MARVQRLLQERRRTVMTLVIAGALVLRLGFVATQPNYRPFADAADYDRVAVSLALHGRYPPSLIAPSGGPTALRPPAYPFLLAAVYRMTGTASSDSRFPVARGLSAVLSTGVVALLGVIATMLWGWGVAALAAMLIAALYPPQVTIGDAMLSEPLFTVFVLGAVAATLAARRGPHGIRWAACSGVLVGLAILTRSNGVILVLPIAAGLWPRPRNRSASIWPAVAAVLAALLVQVPWTVRNTLVFHEFVPLPTQGVFTLAGTFNDVSRLDSRDPAAWRPPTMLPYRALLRPGENEATIERRFRSRIVDYVERHPAYVFEVAYFNTGRLLGLQGPGLEHGAAAETGLGFTTSDIDVYSFYVLACFAIVAAARGGLRKAPVFLWCVPLAIALSLVFVLAYMRYRFPIDPFLILLVAGQLSTSSGSATAEASAPSTRGV